MKRLAVMLCTRRTAVTALAVAAIATGIAWNRLAAAPLDDERIAVLAQQAGAGRDAAALSELKRLAEPADAVAAQRALAEALLARSDADDFAQALRQLERAAAKGDVASHARLGKLYFLGTPLLTRDARKAWQHLSFAAKRQDPVASFYQGLMLRDGFGVAADNAAAARCFAVAAQRQFPAAMFLLANAYRDGDGVPRDEARALALYRAAAELDHAPSAQALALAYQNGELGLTRDEGEAGRYAHEAEHALKHPSPQL